MMKVARPVLVLVLWFVAAFLVVATGTLERIPLPPPAIVAALSLGVLAVVFTSSGARRRALDGDVRMLLLPHLIRFVGTAFLVLVARGVLADAFRAIGWGDLIAALGAVVLLTMRVAPASRSGWWAFLAWNVFGFSDMLYLMATGIRLATVDPSQFTLFRQLPFGLLPTFFVPLIIATHVILFVRLYRTARVARSVAGVA